MGFLAPKIKESGPDPEALAAEREATANAAAERKKEETAKKEESRASAAGLRGQRSLLTGGFLGHPSAKLKI